MGVANHVQLHLADPFHSKLFVSFPKPPLNHKSWFWLVGFPKNWLVTLWPHRRHWRAGRRTCFGRRRPSGRLRRPAARSWKCSSWKGSCLPRSRSCRPPSSFGRRDRGSDWRRPWNWSQKKKILISKFWRIWWPLKNTIAKNKSRAIAGTVAWWGRSYRVAAAAIGTWTQKPWMARQHI